MRNKSIGLVLSLLTVLLTVAALWAPSGASGAVTAPSDGPRDASSRTAARLSVAEMERKVRVLTNRKRVARGCRKLRPHDGLTRAAGRHSARMADVGVLSHQLPGEADLKQRIVKAGYHNPTAWGENVAVGYATPKAVVNAWMDSPGHRANILNCRYRHLGVGLAYGEGLPWWTQDFGRR